jgi:hypothetical protein
VHSKSVLYQYGKIQILFLLTVHTTMAAEAETREFSGKIVTYSGGEGKWRKWSINTNAFASVPVRENTHYFLINCTNNHGC